MAGHADKIGTKKSIKKRATLLVPDTCSGIFGVEGTSQRRFTEPALENS